MNEEDFDDLMETVDELITRINDLTVAIEKLTSVMDFMPNSGFSVGEYD
jgi:hypothetical protein